MRQHSQRLLKAISLYLISDFATYQQFLTAPQWGISMSIATLQCLRELPVPFLHFKEKEIAEWANLHLRILDASRNSDLEDKGLFARKARGG